MLLLPAVKNPGARKQRLEQFIQVTAHASAGAAPENSLRGVTWVVSDLRSKFEIQSLLAEKIGFYQDQQVLRASELWRLLLRRLDPEFKVVSGDLIRARVLDQISSLDLKLATGADKTICDFMDQMSPILFHPEGIEKMQEWFSESPESEKRWGAWYRIAERFAIQFINEKIVAPKWVAPLLLRLLPQAVPQHLWTSDLIFDLGCEMSQVEADLVEYLQEISQVKVLVPAPEFAAKYSSLLAPYEQLARKGRGEESQDLAAPSGENRHKSFRFSSQLAEVKHVTSQIRSWADSGVPLTNIVVIAPDIEVYWPVLALYLQTEGIPCHKEVTTRLQNVPAIARWWALLQLKAGVVDSSNLELATYSGSSPGQSEKTEAYLNYDQFRSLFRNLLDPEDLARNASIARAYTCEINTHEPLNVDQFLGRALTYWRGVEGEEALEIFLKEVLGKVDPTLNMRFSSWLFYCEQILAKKEIKISPLQSNGVVLTNILAGDSLQAQYRLFLGLSEGLLAMRKSPVILPKEISAFNSKFGFFLQNPEANQILFELEWLGTAATVEDHFCFPMTLFDGSLQTPSQFWINLHLKHFGKEALGRLDLPETTRWDEIQSEKERQLKESDGNPVAESLARDLGLRPGVACQVKKQPSLSASSLERFRHCPFTFFCEKVFHLKDLPDLDLDLDRRTKGSLAHALLEKICTPPVEFAMTDQSLLEILDQLRVELPLPAMDEVVWSGIRSQHMQLARRFLQAEKEWAQTYPQNRYLFRELPFKFSYSGFEFSGKIDRIDGDEAGQVILLDYKMGASSVKTFNTWFEQNTLQLAFYTWAVENQLIPELKGKTVVAAFYYVLKSMDRSQGFKLNDVAPGLYDLERKKAQINQEKKEKMILDLAQEISAVTENIKAGNFPPQPRDLKDCPTCNWSELCRAPHLI